MKSEPDELSVEDLRKSGVETWTGVRNYLARNHMRAMRTGDEVLFYHSNADPSGVAGIARVTRTGVVDDTQFDRQSDYHDPKSTREQPRWDCVEVEHVETFPAIVSLDDLRAEPALAGMLVLRRGMRLSVQPVTAAEFRTVVTMGRRARRARATARTRR
jgi:predicted RNA-binding protein with PUA-like domain